MSVEPRRPSRAPVPHRGPVPFLSFIALASLAACSGGSSAERRPGGDSITTGSSFFFVDSNAGGAATEFRLTSFRYGRLVQLFGLDAAGTRVPMGDDFVIGQALESDGFDYLLETNAVTGQENLVVLRDVGDPAGRQQFLALVQAAGADLDTIQVQDLGSTTAVYSMLPRNAAIVLTFDDLLLPSSIDRTTVQLVTGEPPTDPFEARIFPSPYFGGTAGGAFYPTRVVIDLTTSELEAFATDPPLLINGIGLPASLSVGEANGQIRIPTRRNVVAGITKVLSNLTDHQLSTRDNGPVDLVSATRPVTRAFRTGGSPDVISDPFNGFLKDETPPVVVGSTPVAITAPPEQVGGADSVLFRVPALAFESSLCQSPPQRGDVIVQSGVFAQVSADGGPPVDGVARDVLVQLLLFPQAWDGPGDWEIFGAAPATYETAFDPATDLGRPECFVSVSPRPTGFPSAPATGIGTGATTSLRFSEPMARNSLTAFDSVTLTRSPIPEFGNLPTSDYVVGRLERTADLRSVTFVPDQLLAHLQGASESYYLTLADGDDPFPPRDLAGNIVESLPEIRLSIDPQQATQLNGGRVSRFTSIDEEGGNGKPEWTGQFLIDSGRQLIRPRPVLRSQVVIDENQAIVRQMTQFPPGVVTPFSQFGSKMQTVWRYADCGFSLTDPQNINIDIEGLAWAPANGVITPDAFGQFEIRLGHSDRAPDEVINPTSLFPKYRNSGLRNNYSGNVLSGTELAVVHSRELGYTLDSGNLFQTLTGTTLLPFPMNESAAPGEETFYTWRDTSIRSRAGGLNGGVEPEAYFIALGLPMPNRPYFRSGQVQTIGLPLLMEFRTYPDAEAIGQNAWSLALAVNSSSRPYFRAFTTGGVNTSGANVFIDPDAESSANGGFDPTSQPNPGASTFGRDNSVHIGAIDYVTRISRVHSLWYEATIPSESSFTTRAYSSPTLEPAPAEQPPGTRIDTDFRGAVALVYDNSGNFETDNDQDGNGVIDYTEDAFSLDLYGDYYNEVDALGSIGAITHDLPGMNPGISFLGATDEWRDTVGDIAGARYYQVRLTFVGNTASSQTARLSAFALTWTRD